MMKMYKYILIFMLVISQIFLPVSALAFEEMKYGNDISQEIALLKSLGLDLGDEMGRLLTGYDVKKISEVLNAGALIDLIKQDDENVSLGEFLRTILDICGYREYISYNGGYPFGYFKLASRLGIGTSGRNDEAAATVEEAYSMLYDALFVNVLNINAISTGGGLAKYSFSGNETLLEYVFNITYVTGIVTENQKTSIYNKTGNAIVINGLRYICDSGFDKYLGFDVRAYINDDNEIIHMQPTQKNTTISVSGNQILEETTVAKVFAENEKQRRINITVGSAAACIYNGFYHTNTSTKLVTDDDMKNENYHYVFLDNNDDGVYDLIFVEHYTYIKVADIDKDGKYIYDKLSGDKLDLSQKATIRYMDNVFVKFESIQEGDVLAVMVPMGSTLSDLNENFELILLEQKITGAISEIEDDKVTINGKTYETNNRYINAQNLSFGIWNFILDVHGRLLIGEESSKDIPYAYIQSISQKQSSSFQPVMMRVYISGNELAILEVSGNAKVIDPNNRLEGDTNGLGILNSSKYIPQNGALMIGHIVKLNIYDGKVTRIELPKELPYGTAGEEGEFNYIPSRQFFNRKGVLDDQYQVANSIRTYSTPKDTDETEGFEISTFSASFSGTNATCALYNIDSSYNVGLVIAKKSGKFKDSVSATEQIFVVERLFETVVGDERSLGVAGWCNGVFQRHAFIERSIPSLTFDDGNAERRQMIPEQLGFGDIIQISLTGDVIDVFRVLLDCDKDDTFTKTIKSSDKDARTWDVETYRFSTDDSYLAYGTVADKKSSYFEFIVNNSSSLRIFQARATNIYMVDRSQSKVYKRSASDIEFNNPVFVNYIYGIERDVVFYTN